MTFLTIDDFKAVCDMQTLNVINQADTGNLDRAERYAIEEVSSYLRSRFDTAAAFSASGLTPSAKPRTAPSTAGIRRCVSSSRWKARTEACSKSASTLPVWGRGPAE